MEKKSRKKIYTSYDKNRTVSIEMVDWQSQTNRHEAEKKNMYVYTFRKKLSRLYAFAACLPAVFIPFSRSWCSPIMWPNFFMANWHYDDDDYLLLLLLSFSIATAVAAADAGDVIRFISYWTSSTHFLYFHLHSNRFHR